MGTYEVYVVPYDLEGRDGPPSEISYATNLGEVQWLRPTEGQILETYLPTFQWNNIWPEEDQNVSLSWPDYKGGGTEFIVSDAASTSNIYHASNVGWFTTIWRGPNLTSGHQYYGVLSTWGTTRISGVRHHYFGYSRLVGFSAQ